MKTIGFLLLLIILTNTSFAQTVRYVSPVQNGTGDGSSWINASAELQNMIDASVSGDEVWIAQGIYKPTEYATGCTDCATSRNYTFSLKSGVAIYGGFSGSETLLSQRSVELYPTILDGDVDNDGLLNNGNVYSVVTALNTNNSSILDGVTVRNGHSNFGSLFHAGTPLRDIYTSATGGLHAMNAASTIRNCTFTNCRGYSGGAIYSRNSNQSIENCTFDANLLGGAVALVSSTAVITDCLFQNNQAGNYGGGIYNDASTATMKNCVFVNNSAIRGGAISNYNGSNGLMVNCLFAGNTASAEGAAIHNTFFNGAAATNCTFYNNSSPLGCVMFNWQSNGNITNSIMNGNTGTIVGVSNGGVNPVITYSLLQEAYAGTGNVVDVPAFFNSSDLDGTDNRYATVDDGLIQLPTSPGINIGNNGAIPVGTTTDLTGSPRILNTIVDAGSYEIMVCIPPAAPADTTPDTVVCPGSAATLTATGTGTLGWYDSPVGGMYLGGGTTLTTASLMANTVFYVQDSTCGSSLRTAVTIYVTDTLDPVVAVPADTLLIATGGACTVPYSFVISASDDCGTAVINQISGLPSGSAFPIGSTVNQFSVNDGNGNAITVSFTVTVSNQTASAQSITICFGESFQIGMSTYSTSGIYIDTLLSVGGCDSVVTTTLTVSNAIVSSQSSTVCFGESVTVGSSVYTSSGIYFDTLMAVNGCDSVVTTTLTVSNAIVSSQSATVCFGESVAVGSSVYTISGIYFDTLMAANGCDSVVTTTLTVNPLPDVTTTVSGLTVSATLNNATYQWMNCQTTQPIPGETTQTLSPSENGFYAVIVTLNNCSDTSLCVEMIVDLSLDEIVETGWITTVSPNPTNGTAIISSSKDATVELISTLGTVIHQSSLFTQQQVIDLTDLPQGIYLIRLTHNEDQRVIRIVKQ